MKTISKIFFCAVLFMSANVFAQEKPMYEVYSMMMFNFTRYVQWPANDSKEFVIVVVGNKDVYNTLTTWYAGKPKGNQTYVIKNYKSAADVENAQVVFIDTPKSSEFDAINQKVKGKGTLVITNREGLAAKGSNINFTIVDNKLKFELNQKATEASNLKVSGALTSLAILI